MQFTVQVLFLEPGKDDFALNRLTAFLGGQIHGKGLCHTEICLPDGDYGFVSSSIYNGESVSLNKHKTFANPGYIVHTISVGKKQLDDMLDHVHEIHRTGVGFDHMGMFMASLPVQLVPSPRRRTFCSRYVVEVLQAGGLEDVSGLNPSITTPSRLYRVLKAADSRAGRATIAGSVEYKMRGLSALRW